MMKFCLILLLSLSTSLCASTFNSDGGIFESFSSSSVLSEKTLQENHEYGQLFLSHICEENELPIFEDGVPKEGLRTMDVLARIGQLGLITDKLKLSSGGSNGSPLFTDDIIYRYPGLKGGRVWNE